MSDDSYTNDPNVRQIKVASKGYTLVDADDYEWLSQWKWYSLPSGYVYRKPRMATEGYCGNSSIYLHRALTGAPKDFVVDHADNNKRNNCKKNLRVCTRSQNQMNRKPKDNRKGPTSSLYKGVFFDEGVWRARIILSGVARCYGPFGLEKEAALAYNKAALEYFGEFARLNEIE